MHLTLATSVTSAKDVPQPAARVNCKGFKGVKGNVMFLGEISHLGELIVGIMSLTGAEGDGTTLVMHLLTVADRTGVRMQMLISVIGLAREAHHAGGTSSSVAAPKGMGIVGPVIRMTD